MSKSEALFTQYSVSEDAVKNHPSLTGFDLTASAKVRCEKSAC